MVMVLLNYIQKVFYEALGLVNVVETYPGTSKSRYTLGQYLLLIWQHELGRNLRRVVLVYLAYRMDEAWLHRKYILVANKVLLL